MNVKVQLLHKCIPILNAGGIFPGLFIWGLTFIAKLKLDLNVGFYLTFLAVVKNQLIRDLYLYLLRIEKGQS